MSEQTQFNGVKVLSADAGKLTVQVGANDGETIDIDLQEISAKTLGLDGFNVNDSRFEEQARHDLRPAWSPASPRVPRRRTASRPTAAR